VSRAFTIPPVSPKKRPPRNQQAARSRRHWRRASQARKGPNCPPIIGSAGERPLLFNLMSFSQPSHLLAGADYLRSLIPRRVSAGEGRAKHECQAGAGRQSGERGVQISGQNLPEWRASAAAARQRFIIWPGKCEPGGRPRVALVGRKPMRDPSSRFVIRLSDRLVSFSLSTQLNSTQLEYKLKLRLQAKPQLQIILLGAPGLRKLVRL